MKKVFTEISGYIIRMGKVNKNWLRKTLGKKEFNRRETMKIKISVKKSKAKTKKAVRREALAAHEMTRGLANNNTGYYSGEVAGNKAVKDANGVSIRKKSIS